jgi:DNA-binding GntR family transcriptional regulator
MVKRDFVSGSAMKTYPKALLEKSIDVGTETEPQIPRRASVGDDVYEVLLTRLISLKIAPGARINVDGLVKDLGVSQTPIRAALVRLEAEGLVVKTHLVGYSAAPLPSRRRFEQIFELRVLLEPVVAAKAARALTPQDRTALGELHAAMAAPSSDDARLAYGKFATWDAAFHARIATASGSELIAETLARLHTHMHLFRLLFHSRVTEEAIREHADVITALNAGDPDAAYASMERHIVFSQRRMAPIFEILD